MNKKSKKKFETDLKNGTVTIENLNWRYFGLLRNGKTAEAERLRADVMKVAENGVTG